MGANYEVSNTGVATFTNDLIVDSTLLFVDQSTGRIGIGTNSPGTSLEVRGNYVADKGQIYINANSGQNAKIELKADDNREVSIRFHNSGGAVWDIYKIASSNSLGFHDGGDARVVFANGGNVGIGTVTPSEKLEVAGAILIGAAAGTADGTIRWTGTDFEGRKTGAWVTLAAGAGVTQLAKITKSHSDLQTAGLTNDIEVFSLPAGGVINSVKLKHSIIFAGTGITDYKVSVGKVGDLTKYKGQFDVDTAVSDTNFSVEGLIGGEDHGSAASIRLAAVATGANLDQSTGGSVDVWIEYIVMT